MVQICSPTFAFTLLVVIQSVSSVLEGNIGELHFTIPNEAKDFDGAVSWCKNNSNSTLAVVNNTYTQTALQQFLDSSDMTPKPTMFINIRLKAEQTDTWYLINGQRYNGGVGNQNPEHSWWTRYLLYCHLQNESGSHYTVVASIPGERRYYICQYDENRCSSDSARNIVYMGKCYVKYENESLTWYEARERCINDGGDLATFQSDPSNSWISPTQFNTSWLSNSSTYWVGIRYKNWSWKYTYEDNKEANFTWWSDGKPNNYEYSCVCVDPNGNSSWSWTDCDCTTLRPFVCLKRVDIQTTTVITTTPMHPTTTVGQTDIKTNTGPKLTTITDTNQTLSAAKIGLSETAIIGLAVGIGGGGLIILIVLIVVLVVIFKRRRRRSKGSDGSKSEMQGVVEDSDKPENGGGVYAAVVPNGKNQGKATDPRSEIIYTSPEFTKELNSKGHTNSSYEDANSVKDPDAISTFRGQTRSIFPQGFTELYANADEVPKSID